MKNPDQDNTGKVFLIADGTYLYTEKSEQHKFQRLVLFTQKKKLYKSDEYRYD